jgi:hypothetical protein
VPSGGDVALVAIEKISVQQRYDTFYDGFGGWRRFGGFGESTTTVDDLTDAALAQISTDTLKELAGFHNVLAEHTITGMPVAVVAPRDLEYGLSQMWQVFVEENGWETMVCRLRTEAERWLQQRLTETSGNDVCELKLNETACESRPATDCNGPQPVRPERSGS